MAITYLDTADIGTSGETADQSGAFDCAGGNMLVASVSVRENGVHIDACNYDGVELTLLSTLNYDEATLALYYMLNPPSGSNTFAFSLDATGSTSCAVVSSWRGVRPVTPFGSADQASAAGAAISNTYASTTLGAIVIDCMGQFYTAWPWGITVTGSNTLVNTHITNDGATLASLNGTGHSYIASTGGNVVLSWGSGGATASASIAIEMFPALGAGGVMWWS